MIVFADGSTSKKQHVYSWGFITLNGDDYTEHYGIRDGSCRGKHEYVAFAEATNHVAHLHPRDVTFCIDDASLVDASNRYANNQNIDAVLDILRLVCLKHGNFDVAKKFLFESRIDKFIKQQNRVYAWRCHYLALYARDKQHEPFLPFNEWLSKGIVTHYMPDYTGEAKPVIFRPPFTT